jgi:hypothetical protein
MKSNKGGKRIGAGRKPCTDKKQQLTIYVLTSQIEKLGKDAIRQVCEKAINEAVFETVTNCHALKMR